MIQSVMGRYETIKQQIQENSTNEIGMSFIKIIVKDINQCSKEDQYRLGSLKQKLQSLIDLKNKAVQTRMSLIELNKEANKIFCQQDLRKNQSEQNMIDNIFQKFKPKGVPKSFKTLLTVKENQNILPIRSTSPLMKNITENKLINDIDSFIKGGTHQHKSSNSQMQFGKQTISQISRKSWKSITKTPQKIINANKKKIQQLHKHYEDEQDLIKFQKKLLKEQKDRCLEKISNLEAQVQTLSRQNYIFKKDKKQMSNLSMQFNNIQQDNFHSPIPYVIMTRPNDFNKIQIKNQAYSHSGPFVKKQKLFSENLFSQGHASQKISKQDNNSSDSSILKELVQELQIKKLQKRSQFNHLQQNNSPFILPFLDANMLNNSPSINSSCFDTFQMTQGSNFINKIDLSDSRHRAKMSSTLSTRNKVAFFKQSLIILREQGFQMAFKRSKISQKVQKLVFYINNKTESTKSVQINYAAQPEYYRIEVKEKLMKIDGKQQAREVIEVHFVGEDLNSVADMQLTFGDREFDLWLPASFIDFCEPAAKFVAKEGMQSMEVVPDRQFKSFESAVQVMPLLKMGKNALLQGNSLFGKYYVQFCWKDKLLQITTTGKWIDFIAFIIHSYK